MRATVLATGGAGYIGSHVVVELMAAGHRVVILDDFSNASEDTLGRIAAVGHGAAELVSGDIRDPAALDAAFAGRGVDAVIHLAGLKAVGESVAQPLRYFDVNVGGAVALFEAMARHRVRRLVFSSSATVYGAPEANPIPEAAPLAALEPVRADQADDRADHRRPGGGAAGARGGLAALLQPGRGAQVRADRREPEGGAEQPLPLHRADGRGPPRSVADLRRRLSDAGRDRGARLYPRRRPGARASGGARLPARAARASGGTCRSTSAAAAATACSSSVEAFARAAGREIPYEIVGRRPGDVAECVADARRAAEIFGWRATRGLEEMCADHWAYQSRALAA